MVLVSGAPPHCLFRRWGAPRLGVAVELRYLDAPIDELVRRIETRNDKAGITRANLEEWQHVIEVPTPAELELFDAPA
jgi:hypothetical protein